MVKRNFARPFYPQNYDFAVFFCPRNLRMTGRSIQFAAKAVLMNRQKNLIIFNFTIFPSNLKKQKYKYMRFKIMSVYWATLHVYIGQRPDMVYLPPRGNFVDHDFLEASCLASFLQHVSPLAMEALPSNSPLHMLPIQRHKFNIKRTEVRIHVNICRCSIKSYFI